MNEIDQMIRATIVHEVADDDDDAAEARRFFGVM